MENRSTDSRKYELISRNNGEKFRTGNGTEGSNFPQKLIWNRFMSNDEGTVTNLLQCRSLARSDIVDETKSGDGLYKRPFAMNFVNMGKYFSQKKDSDEI